MIVPEKLVVRNPPLLYQRESVCVCVRERERRSEYQILYVCESNTQSACERRGSVMALQLNFPCCSIFWCSILLLGAYYMKWLNFSFQEALELDDEIAGREVEFLFRNAFQW